MGKKLEINIKKKGFETVDVEPSESNKDAQKMPEVNEDKKQDSDIQNHPKFAKFKGEK